MATWLEPRTPIELFGMVMGLTAAVFCVLSSSSGAGDKGPFHASTRFQGLAWVCGGGFATFVVNWKAVYPAEIDQARLLGVYASWALVGIAGAFGFGIASIVINAAASRSKAARRALPSMIVRFVVDGWAAYDAARLAIEASDGDSASREEAARQRSATEAACQTAFAVAALSLEVLDALPDSNEESRRILAVSIAKAIRAEALRLAPDPKPAVNLSYFLARVPDPAEPSHGRVLYEFDAPEAPSAARYTHVLDLAYRLDLPLGPSIAVPVDDAVRFASYLLPGAPTAFVTRRPQIMTRNARRRFDPPFQDGVPAATRKALCDYLDSLPCQSFASIPLLTGRSAVGVLNVESTEHWLIGRDKAAAEALCTRLGLFCQVLAHVLEREHDAHAVR